MRARTRNYDGQASIAPYIPSWLRKLPSKVSGHTSTDPAALVSPHFPICPQFNAAQRHTPLRAVRPSQGWVYSESVGVGSSVSQRSSSNHRTASCCQPPSAHQLAAAHQSATVRQEHQTRSAYQNPPMQQMPQAQPRTAPASAARNYYHDDTPVDSRMNITTNSQRYYTDHGYHWSANAPHTVHIHKIQRHVVDNSRSDSTMQSTDVSTVDSCSTPMRQEADAPERVDSPPESHGQVQEGHVLQ